MAPTDLSRPRSARSADSDGRRDTARAGGAEGLFRLCVICFVVSPCRMHGDVSEPQASPLELDRINCFQGAPAVRDTFSRLL